MAFDLFDGMKPLCNRIVTPQKRECRKLVERSQWYANNDSPEKRSFSPPRRCASEGCRTQRFLNKSVRIFTCTGHFTKDVQLNLKSLGVLCAFAVKFQFFSVESTMLMCVVLTDKGNGVKYSPNKRKNYGT
jgi:hypothetical protein